MNSVRALIAALGILSALFISPWITAFCMIALSVRYRAYEVIVMGLLTDFMWLPYTGVFYSLPLFTLFGVILVWILEPLRLEFLR